jgi:hypothetical protein
MFNPLFAGEPVDHLRSHRRFHVVNDAAKAVDFLLDQLDFARYFNVTKLGLIDGVERPTRKGDKNQQRYCPCVFLKACPFAPAVNH